MNSNPNRREAFTLVEILIATVVIGVMSGLAVATLGGVRERAREARLQNDVAVVNNGIDAYVASGGVIPSGATPEQVLAKLKTVASPDSTALGFPGPFVDRRLQLFMQSGDEAATEQARADYPNQSGYFYVRRDGGPGVKEFVKGEESALVTETRTGSMPYTPEGEFLTGYTDQPAASPLAVAAPEAVGRADEAAKTGRDLVKFPRPCNMEVRKWGSASEWLLYGGEELAVSSEGDGGFFPAEARISSGLPPNVAQLVYQINRGAEMTAPTDPFILPVRIDPDDEVLITAVSLDPTRYVSSDPCAVAFKSDPAPLEVGGPGGGDCPPALLTYAEAGGAMVDQETIVRDPFVVELKNIAFVPLEYRTSEYLQAESFTTTTARYTDVETTATNTSFSAPTFSDVVVPIDVAGFGQNSTIRVQAEIIDYNPKVVSVAGTINCTISINPTPLTVDVFPLKPIGLPPAITITSSGDAPVGLRRVYTLTTGSLGADPLDPASGGVPLAGAISYAGPITNFPIATHTVVAQATGPVGTEHWFTSTPVSRTYIAITRVPLEYIGLNMFRANINGYVKGSIYMQAGNFAVLNAGATIEGNVYVPGTPSVFLPGSGSTLVAAGQSYDQSRDARIAADRISGQEYTTEGTLADPQQDLRKIVDLFGAFQPSNYEVRVNSSARIDGKLYRRADPPAISSEKPELPSEIALTNTAVTVSGTQSLAGGSYAVTLNNIDSVLQLGAPGTLTQYVFGPGSTWTAGRVEILGPVQVYFNANTTISGVMFGSSVNIAETGLVVMSDYSITINNEGAVYGQFEARDSIITVGSGGGQTISGSFFGSAFAREVSVAGSGYVDVSGGFLPPEEQP